MRKNTLILLLLITLPVGTIFSYRCYELYKEKQRERSLFEKRKDLWNNLGQRLVSEINQFKAESGIVIKDLKTGWEFFYKKDKLFPSASLVKIPIMAACFLACQEGRLELKHSVRLKVTDKLGGSGALKNTPPGTTFTVKELIGLMIYDSDNTATNMLTNMLGMDYLNNAFKAFGLKNTNLFRRVADFSLRNKGVENYTSPEDMALILEKIYKGNLINKNVSEGCLGLLKLQRINNRIPKYLPHNLVVAHKTGLERDICHDAGIVFTDKGDFLICVLTKHRDSNSRSCKEFIAKLALYVYNYFEQF